MVWTLVASKEKLMLILVYIALSVWQPAYDLLANVTHNTTVIMFSLFFPFLQVHGLTYKQEKVKKKTSSAHIWMSPLFFSLCFLVL